MNFLPFWIIKSSMLTMHRKKCGQSFRAKEKDLILIIIRCLFFLSNLCSNVDFLKLLLALKLLNLFSFILRLSIHFVNFTLNWFLALFLQIQQFIMQLIHIKFAFKQFLLDFFIWCPINFDFILALKIFQMPTKV